MPKAVVIHATGGPEQLNWEAFDPGMPGKGEVLIRQEAVGLNFIDVYHRTGLYPLQSLPAVIGMEGAGLVVKTGDGVDDLKSGDRVAYASQPIGAYAEQRRMPADRLVKLPEDISTQQAAAMMLKGMTARYLLFGCFHVKAGDTILVHAAAGGVGQIVCQWASHLGATVLGTVGSAEKAELARNSGCRHPIVYTEADFEAAVKDLTKGRGVDVVYDSVGQATFQKSLRCLRPMGMMVSFGQSSGSVPPFDPALLAAGGSLFLTRPSLFHYTARRGALLTHASDLFDAVRQGAVKVNIGRTYPLSAAAEAHRDLEARKTTGSVLLIP